MAIWRTCEHLRSSAGEGLTYARAFTGAGLHYNLVCAQCGQEHFEADAQKWREVGPAEFQSIEIEGSWVGVVGQPEVKFAPSGQRFSHEVVHLDGVDARVVKTIAPFANNCHAIMLLQI